MKALKINTPPAILCKLIALILAMALMVSLAACGGDDEKPSGNNDDPPASGQQQTQNTPDPDEGEDEPEETPAPDTSEQEQPEDTSGEDEKISVYGDGTIVIVDCYTTYNRDGYGELSIELCYSNGDIVKFEEERDMLQGTEVSAEEWGFSTTDSVCTLTIAGWTSNEYVEVSEIEVRFEGITEDEFVRGLKNLTDITYEPVAGKEIKTVNGEIIEGFTLSGF